MNSQQLEPLSYEALNAVNGGMRNGLRSIAQVQHQQKESSNEGSPQTLVPTVSIQSDQMSTSICIDMPLPNRCENLSGFEPIDEDEQKSIEGGNGWVGPAGIVIMLSFSDTAIGEHSTSTQQMSSLQTNVNHDGLSFNRCENLSRLEPIDEHEQQAVSGGNGWVGPTGIIIMPSFSGTAIGEHSTSTQQMSSLQTNVNHDGLSFNRCENLSRLEPVDDEEQQLVEGGNGWVGPAGIIIMPTFSGTAIGEHSTGSHTTGFLQNNVSDSGMSINRCENLSTFEPIDEDLQQSVEGGNGWVGPTGIIIMPTFSGTTVGEHSMDGQHTNSRQTNVNHDGLSLNRCENLSRLEPTDENEQQSVTGGNGWVGPAGIIIMPNFSGTALGEHSTSSQTSGSFHTNVRDEGLTMNRCENVASFEPIDEDQQQSVAGGNGFYASVSGNQVIIMSGFSGTAIGDHFTGTQVASSFRTHVNQDGLSINRCENLSGFETINEHELHSVEGGNGWVGPAGIIIMPGFSGTTIGEHSSSQFASHYTDGLEDNESKLQFG